MMPDMAFEVGEARLAPEEGLLAFTDGVTEARDERGVFYGEERLLEALASPISSAETLLEAVEAGVAAHVGGAEQSDDRTLLAVRRSPAA